MAFPNISMTGSALAGGIVSRDVEFFDDFIIHSGIEDGGFASTTADKGGWLATLTGSTPTAVIANDEPGGVLHITTSASDNDSAEFQLNGEAFKVAADKDMVFECKLKLTAAASPLTTIDWFVGVATTDTTVLDGTTERIGFGSNGLNAGGADIYYFVEDNSTETSGDTGVDYVDDTYVTLGFHVIGNGRVKLYVNGAEKASVTTNIPDGDAITPTICIQNNAGAAKQMLVDYIYVAQKR